MNKDFLSHSLLDFSLLLSLVSSSNIELLDSSELCQCERYREQSENTRLAFDVPVDEPLIDMDVKRRWGNILLKGAKVTVTLVRNGS